MENSISIVFQTDLKFMELSIMVLNYLKTMLGINEDEYFKIEISVREALNNAIVHGNHMEFQKKVFVDYTWDRSQLRMIIRDENNDFVDFRNIEEKLRSREILSCSGRGFMIMKNYMDKVEFNCLDRGNEIILEKRLP